MEKTSNVNKDKKNITFMKLLRAKAICEHTAKASEFMDKKMFADAIREWKEVLALDKDNLEVHYNTAVAYFEINDYKKAEKHCSKILKNSPFDFKYLKLAGKISMQIDDFQSAVKYLSTAISYEACDCDCLLLLSDALMKTHMEQESIQCLDRVISMYPDDYRPVIRKAVILNNYDDFHASVNILRDYLKDYPDCGPVYFYLGCIYAEHEWVDHAVSCFRHADRVVENFTLAQVCLARALRELGRMNEAANCLSEIIKREPSCEQAVAILADMCINSGAHEDSEKLIDEFLKNYTPTFVALYVMKAVILEYRAIETENVKLHAEAAEYYRKAAAIEQDDQHLAFLLASALLKSGDFRKALKESEAFLKKHPDSQEVSHFAEDIRLSAEKSSKKKKK